MSYFKAKMHQIRFHQIPLGKLTVTPDTVAAFKGSYF